MTVTFASLDIVDSTIPTTYQPRATSQTYAHDLNRDGYSDLLVLGASYPGSGSPVAQPSLVAFGNGDGTFTLATQAQFPFASLNTVHPREVVFADFNHDGWEDVFVASHGYDAEPFPGEQNQLYLSNGDGSWHNATANLPGLSDFTHSAAVGDVNGDGHLDIVVGDQTPAAPPHVLVGDGQGHFTRNDSILPTGAGGALDIQVRRVTSVLLADLDGDGKQDLVAGAAFSTTAQPVTSQVMWNQGGTYSGASATDLPFPATYGATQLVYDVQAVDVNYDGILDLILAYQNSTGLGGWELQVLVNDGHRHFTDQTTTYLPDAAMRTNGIPSPSNALSQYWVQFVEVADLNGDGRPDFTLNARGTTSAPSAMPVAYIHQADGTFAVATVADLGGTGNQWVFDYSTVAVQLAGTTGFAHFYIDGSGKPVIHVLPVLFDRAHTLVGGSGNDRYTGGLGSDAIDGGNGIDTVAYAGARASFTIAAGANGYTVTDGTGTEGTDTLTNVERLVFADAKVALDVHGNAGMAYRLYQAAFDRAPDIGGLGYQMNALDTGLTLTQVAQNFLNSPEFVLTYGGLSNTDFVTQLYLNVLHRAPEDSGLAYHVNDLSHGVERAQILANFSESPENQANVIGTIQNGMLYVF